MEKHICEIILISDQEEMMFKVKIIVRICLLIAIAHLEPSAVVS